MVYILLCLGLGLLVYGGNLLVDGSVAVAKRLRLSSLIIGLVLVGFGTSTPELLASLVSVFEKSEGIAVGNVVGSNIANILLVLGMASLIHPVQIEIKPFRRDGLMLVIATALLMLTGWLGVITRVFGIIFLVSITAYVAYSYYSDKKTYHEETNPDEKIPNGWFAFLKAVCGIALTIAGAKLLVDNAIELARVWGVSESVIGLTVVAVGTSLPELSASVIASFKKENGVAFGNVVGSNIYNALFILGVVALFMPVNIPVGMGKDMVMMGATTALLCGIAVWQKRFSRGVGVLFLALYAGYTWYLF